MSRPFRATSMKYLPDVYAGLIGVSFLFSLIMVFAPQSKRSSQERVVPILTERFIGGVSALGPGQKLTLMAIDEKKSVTRFLDLRVKYVQEGSGSAVFITLGDKEAQQLALLLTDTKVQFVYQLLADRDSDKAPVSGGASPPKMDCPAPSTPAAPKMASLEIPAALSSSRLSSLRKDTWLQLVLITEKPSPQQADAKIVAPPLLQTEKSCVEVEALLDEKGKELTETGASPSGFVRVRLPSSDLATIATALVNTRKLWLVPDEGCVDPNAKKPASSPSGAPQNTTAQGGQTQ